ncbi:hypothetical protein HK12_04635 [Acetobacter orientalis]|uniref:Uncharacterized protein n=1 Tax=Acetobacter orientalis TaxID=146474 RepID=A0A252A2G5_9PROT|nr:hypothetical protein HK12_04635 [Acetobacter orientalis]
MGMVKRRLRRSVKLRLVGLGCLGKRTFTCDALRRQRAKGRVGMVSFFFHAHTLFYFGVFNGLVFCKGTACDLTVLVKT